MAETLDKNENNAQEAEFGLQAENHDNQAADKASQAVPAGDAAVKTAAADAGNMPETPLDEPRWAHIDPNLLYSDRPKAPVRDYLQEIRQNENLPPEIYQSLLRAQESIGQSLPASGDTPPIFDETQAFSDRLATPKPERAAESAPAPTDFPISETAKTASETPQTPQTAPETPETPPAPGNTGDTKVPEQQTAKGTPAREDNTPHTSDEAVLPSGKSTSASTPAPPDTDTISKAENVSARADSSLDKMSDPLISNQTSDSSRAETETAGKKAKKKGGIGHFSFGSLAYGRRNFVDAAATLLILHILLTLSLEQLWRILPTSFIGVQKAGFAAFLLATAATQGLTLLLPLFAVYKLYHTPGEAIIGRLRQDPVVTVTALLMGIPAALFFNGLNNMTTYWLTLLDIGLPSQILPTWMKPQSGSDLIAACLVAALLPAILEELFFRGFLQKALSGLGRPFLPILLQAGIFAFYHNDPLFFIGPLGAGILLGLLRRDSESLVPAMLTHLSMNLATFILEPVLPRFNVRMVLLFPSEGRATLIANIVAAVASGVVLYFVYRFLTQHLARENLTVGLMSGKRAAVYGRNRQAAPLAKKSPDRSYKLPKLSWENYLRLAIAGALFLVLRLLF